MVSLKEAMEKVFLMDGQGVMDKAGAISEAPERAFLSSSHAEQPSLAISTLAIASIITLILLSGLLNAPDYIGPDNDDVMRLIEVRDLVAGQGWFDLQQYRLGLDGGTLMHWSRIIDAPMAGLMIFFSLFTSGRQAEILAVSIWPLTLIFPFIWATGRGAFHLGGRRAMVFAQLLAAVFTVSVHRFHPGSIDHHNAQIALIALLIAMMLDPARKTSSFVIAGLAASIALVIGAETTPLLAVLAVIIAAFWGIYGVDYRKAAIAFGFSFAGFVSIAFLAFVPPSQYTTVTCDSFSVSYASLSIAGGILLVSGALVACLLLKVAPQCLQNPYASLDPLLVVFWLNNVAEAKSFFSELHDNPATIGAFYAVGLLSLIICAHRIRKSENVRAYSILLVASVAAFLLSCIQIRGFIFTSTISIFPISALLADLHKAYRAEPANTKSALAFIGMSLIATPFAWGFGGMLLSPIFQTASEPVTGGEVTERKLCREASDMIQLASLPPGLVAGASNIGAHILRYTNSSALSGPYHRNPNGMLTELKIEMASFADAEKIMRSNNIRYYVTCDTYPETGKVIYTSPNGFIANLEKGIVPDYLEKLPKPAGSNLTVYTLRPATGAS